MLTREDTINKIKQVMIQTRLLIDVPESVVAQYIAGNVRGEKRTKVTAEDLEGEAKAIKTSCKICGTSLDELKGCVKKYNIDLNDIIAKTNEDKDEEKDYTSEYEEVESDMLESILGNNIEEEPEKEEIEGEELEEEEELEGEEPEEEEELEGEEPEEEEELEDEEPEEEEELEDEKTKKSKAQKLEDKINALYEKIEKEKSPLKIHINQFKIRNLIDKLQKEIDIQNIKEKYSQKRKDLLRIKDNEEADLFFDISKLQEDINKIENVLNGNREYDYGSKQFMYPKDHIERHGGVDKLTENLKSKGSKRLEYTAKKIEEMKNKRQELEKLKEELKEAQEELSNLDNIHEKYEKRINKKEKSMIAYKNKPLQNIRRWFSNAFTEAKAYLADRKDYKNLKEQERKEIEKQKEVYEKMWKEDRLTIKSEYKKQQMEIRKNKLREAQAKMGVKLSDEQLAEVNEETTKSNLKEKFIKGTYTTEDNKTKPSGGDEIDI